jgi:hypothetical protein
MAISLVPGLAPRLSAQTTPDTQQQQPDSTQSQQQAPLEQLPQQSPQDRARVLKEAQARVMTRRRMREQQIIQDTYSHKFELYGGGGYLRFRPGPSLQHENETAWNLGITEWIRPKLGITGDFRGYYGNANTLVNPYQVFQPSISQYTFMAGPQYRFYAKQHIAVSAEVLGGVGHGNFGTGTNGFPATLVGLYSNANVFNVDVGLPVEYNLSPGLAVHLTPNYLLTDYGSQLQHNLGFTTGFVYRFGRQ